MRDERAQQRDVDKNGCAVTFHANRLQQSSRCAKLRVLEPLDKQPQASTAPKNAEYDVEEPAVPRFEPHLLPQQGDDLGGAISGFIAHWISIPLRLSPAFERA